MKERKEEYPLQIRQDQTGVVIQKRSNAGRLNVIYLTNKELILLANCINKEADRNE